MQNQAARRHYDAIQRRRARQSNPAPVSEYCYEIATGTLRSTPADDLDGLELELIALKPAVDGSLQAVVSSETFAPASTIQVVPICDDVVVGCCYDPTTETLKCPNSDLDGAPAGIVAAWTDDSGQIYVWAAWTGGGGRMPLCPGSTECPPVFCCVNVQTFEYVCPGIPDLDGQVASITEIVLEDGYTWAVLDDGTKIPLCGLNIPAPRIGSGSKATPGQWISLEEKHCCSSCARNGPCEGERASNPCCDSCAEGKPCESEMPKANPCCESCAHGGPCKGEIKKNPRRRVFGRSR